MRKKPPVFKEATSLNYFQYTFIAIQSIFKNPSIFLNYFIGTTSYQIEFHFFARVSFYLLCALLWMKINWLNELEEDTLAEDLFARPFYICSFWLQAHH